MIGHLWEVGGIELTKIGLSRVARTFLSIVLATWYNQQFSRAINFPLPLCYLGQSTICHHENRNIRPLFYEFSPYQ